MYVLIYIYIYTYIDFLLRRLIIKRVRYSPELVLFKTFRNLVRHDNSKKNKRMYRKNSKCNNKSTDTHPETLQHGPLGRSWGNLFVESVLDRTLDRFLTCFGAFGWALETISASLGAKNITQNRYQFEVLCWTRFCLSFWSTLGSLESAFGSFLDIFSGMAAKVKTVLALARRLDFQGLGPSGSVLFEGLARTSFWETSFERICIDLGRFGRPFGHPFRETLGPFWDGAHRNREPVWKRMRTVRKPSQGGCQSLSKRQGIWLDLLYIYIYIYIYYTCFFFCWALNYYNSLCEQAIAESNTCYAYVKCIHHQLRKLRFLTR